MQPDFSSRKRLVPETARMTKRQLRRLKANQANAAKSTGPRTEEGKAISARNNFRHGFAGSFLVLPTEDAAAYQLLRNDLLKEHDPQTPTEQILVDGLAQHHWLAQRALRLQDQLFVGSDLADPAIQKQLALYIRYQTTNERAFHKCLADLLKLRKSSVSKEIGFESQNHSEEVPYGPGHPEFEAVTNEFLENYNRKLAQQNPARKQGEERSDKAKS